MNTEHHILNAPSNRNRERIATQTMSSVDYIFGTHRRKDDTRQTAMNALCINCIGKIHSITKKTTERTNEPETKTKQNKPVLQYSNNNYAQMEQEERQHKERNNEDVQRLLRCDTVIIMKIPRIELLLSSF